MTITVNGRTYDVFGNNEDPERNKYPHIVDTGTGQIPHGEQKEILRRYLDQHNVHYENGTTHQMVRLVLNLDLDSSR